MKVAFFDVEPWQAEHLRDTLRHRGLDKHIDASFAEESLSDAVLQRLQDYEAIAVFVWTKVSREVIEKLPKLRLILAMSTGYDHIDVEACAKHGIIVCNVPRYGENTVAEHTFALILTLSRKLREAYYQVQHGEFSIRDLRGFDLYGKTLGVIGAGSIGLHVIRIGRAFGMHVLAYDAKPQPLLAEVLGFTYVDLDTLLSHSDVVTLHVPAVPQTHHLINRETLSKMKRGALLINTARGSVMDTEAVLWALDEGILGGAGLDVVEGEEYIKEESILWRMPLTEQVLRNVVQAQLLMRRRNVVFTPHIAFNSYEAVLRILDTTIDNLEAFWRGASINAVPLPAVSPS